MFSSLPSPQTSGFSATQLFCPLFFLVKSRPPLYARGAPPPLPHLARPPLTPPPQSVPGMHSHPVSFPSSRRETPVFTAAYPFLFQFRAVMPSFSPFFLWLLCPHRNNQPAFLSTKIQSTTHSLNHATPPPRLLISSFSLQLWFALPFFPDCRN